MKIIWIQKFPTVVSYLKKTESAMKNDVEGRFTKNLKKRLVKVPTWYRDYSEQVHRSLVAWLTLIKILLCSERDFVFWKCSRFFLKASSSNLSASSVSSSPNEMCELPLAFLALLASSLISSANGLELSSDSKMGLKLALGFCCCNFGELEMLSAEVSMTTVSRLVEVVEFDKVPSGACWFTLL